MDKISSIKRMIKTLLCTFFLIISLILEAQSQKKEINTNDSILGHYYSYRMLYEDVTEMPYTKAKKLLNKQMEIKTNRFILFRDTLHNPVYRREIMSKHDFLNEYTVDENLFNNLKDTLTIIFVTKDDDYEETRIIIFNKNLIANYKGYFYFFRRSSHVSARTKKP